MAFDIVALVLIAGTLGSGFLVMAREGMKQAGEDQNRSSAKTHSSKDSP